MPKKHKKVGRPETPAHLRCVRKTVHIPQWLSDWMDAHQETAGHIVREAVIEHNKLRPPRG